MAHPDTAAEHHTNDTLCRWNQSFARPEGKRDRVVRRHAARLRLIASRLRGATQARAAAVPPPRRSLVAAIGTRVSAGQLDRALTISNDPSNGPLLARRAMQLTTRRTRARFPNVLERPLAEARRPRAGLSAAIPIRACEVLPATANFDAS